MVFYPSCADKGVLCEHLRAFDFDQCDHLWDWPEDSANFSWFEIEDFQSFDGVEATVFPTSDEEKKDYPKTAWALHTRTRVWASSRDLEQQNEVIRAARKQFGGCFINDSYGKNRYIPVPPDLRDSVARGIYLVPSTGPIPPSPTIPAPRTLAPVSSTTASSPSPLD